MGMMSIRRSVISAENMYHMVGQFSVYRKYDIEAQQNRIVFLHDLNVVHRLVIFHYDKPSTDSASYLCYGLFGDIIGVATNLNNNNGYKYAFKVITNESEYRPSSLPDASAFIGTSRIDIARVSPSVSYKPTQIYTVELYA